MQTIETNNFPQAFLCEGYKTKEFEYNALKVSRYTEF